MKKEIGILVVAAATSFVEELEHELRRAGLSHRFRRVESKEGFLHQLQKACPDVILANHGVPAFDSTTALSIALENRPDVPFILVTANRPGVSRAVEAEAGVLSSPLSKLAPTLRRALRDASKRRKLRDAQLTALTSRWLGSHRRGAASQGAV